MAEIHISADPMHSIGPEFEAHRSQLKSYLFRLTAHREDTEDLLQDTYIKAAEKFQGFENRSSLKTWLFAIATNLARDRLRSKKRWPVYAMDLARDESMRHPEIHVSRFIQVNQTAAQGAFEIQEHINFCFTCIGKTLSIDQQIALLLKEIFDYKIHEIAEIMDSSEGVVKHLLFDSRKTMQHIFAKRCSLINKEGVCHQCSELNGLFNPRQDFQQRLLSLDIGKDGDGRDNEQLFDLRTRIARAIDPYESKGAELQFCHLDHVNQVLQTQNQDS